MRSVIPALPVSVSVLRLPSAPVKRKRGAKSRSCQLQPVFTEKMRKDYTILCPQMTPIHLIFLETAFNASATSEVLNRDEREAVNLGLKYVNNDACDPSIIVVGQIMSALLPANMTSAKQQS